MILKVVDLIGAKALSICNTTGDFMIFFWRVLKTMFTTKLKMKQLFGHMEMIGVGSFFIVLLTGASTGLALSLQSYIGFSRVGAEDFIGLVVALGLTRELGPVLSGLITTGRCGSAIAAEIGSMQITEQIDALKTLRINTFQYLVVPRIIASTIMMPFLAIFAMICGIIAGYFFCIYALGLNSETYVSMIQERMELKDITGGLIKSAFFGLIFSWVGTYYGYKTRGGAQGVGRATTRSVVVGSIIILVSNYFLSSFLFQTGIS